MKELKGIVFLHIIIFKVLHQNKDKNLNHNKSRRSYIYNKEKRSYNCATIDSFLAVFCLHHIEHKHPPIFSCTAPEKSDQRSSEI